MITIKVITDLKEAEFLWRTLSSRQAVVDEWSFRYCFYKYNPHPLKFITAYDDEEPVGLLPLSRHPEYGLEFMAEDPCEDNRVFIKAGYESVIPKLYEAVDETTKCFDIAGSDEFTAKFPLEDYKYVLPLAGLNNFSDFLKTRLNPKRRRSLEKELSDLSQSEIIMAFSRPDEMAENLQLLFKFNLKNFAAESYLLAKEQAAWLDLLKLDFDWRLMTLEIKGLKQAAALSIFYNNHWHYLITGVNFKDFPGLGKYLTKLNIEAAIAAKATVFDAGLGDCGWKHLWHFDKIPQYEFIKVVAENTPVEPVSALAESA